MDDLLNIPDWGRVLALIISGGALTSLYKAFIGNNKNIRDELWERMNKLEKGLNEQREINNKIYAHVIYLESILLEHGIKFISFSEKSFKGKETHYKYNNGTSKPKEKYTSREEDK